MVLSTAVLAASATPITGTAWRLYQPCLQLWQISGSLSSRFGRTCRRQIGSLGWTLGLLRFGSLLCSCQSGGHIVSSAPDSRIRSIDLLVQVHVISRSRRMALRTLSSLQRSLNGQR